MAKENGMTKQLILMGVIISIITSIFSIGGAWAVGEHKDDVEQKKLNAVSDKTEALILDVNTIKTENKTRDEKDDKAEDFEKFMTKWMIDDAKWKGAMGKALNQSMYYGDSGKLGDLLKISDENKKNVSKKKSE